MREYRHKNHPELIASIQYPWHKEYRKDNYQLLWNREVILVRVNDDQIENNPFWILIYDSEEEGKDEVTMGDIGSDDIQQRQTD